MKEKKFYTVKELLDIIPIRRASAYKYIAAGLIPSLRLDKKILIPAAVVEKMVAGEWKPYRS